MQSNRKIAIIVGILFIIATLSFAIGSGIIDSLTASEDYLITMYQNKILLVTGILLELVNSIAVIGIALFLFPILKKYNENIARGYVSFRILEAVSLIIGATGLLLLLPLSQEFAKTGITDSRTMQTIGVLIIKFHYYSFQMAMLVLGLYSLIFCSLLYQSKLVPRILSVVGFIGYIALIASAILEFSGYNISAYLYIPGGLFEFILPVWLFVKGFNLSELQTK